jgi:hypothetical protein
MSKNLSGIFAERHESGKRGSSVGTIAYAVRDSEPEGAAPGVSWWLLLMLPKSQAEKTGGWE